MFNDESASEWYVSFPENISRVRLAPDPNNEQGVVHGVLQYSAKGVNSWRHVYKLDHPVNELVCIGLPTSADRLEHWKQDVQKEIHILTQPAYRNCGFAKARILRILGDTLPTVMWEGYTGDFFKLTNLSATETWRGLYLAMRMTLVDQVCCLYNNGFVYMDLKPENILYRKVRQNGEVVYSFTLCDLATAQPKSTFLNNKRSLSLTYTPKYADPDLHHYLFPTISRPALSEDDGKVFMCIWLQAFETRLFRLVGLPPPSGTIFALARTTFQLGDDLVYKHERRRLRAYLPSTPAPLRARRHQSAPSKLRRAYSSPLVNRGGPTPQPRAKDPEVSERVG
jgi:hypothetical protein